MQAFVLSRVGVLEFKLHGGNMFDNGRKPGDIGFDHMGMGKKNLPSMQLKELKNGRLDTVMRGLSQSVCKRLQLPTLIYKHFFVFNPIFDTRFITLFLGVTSCI